MKKSVVRIALVALFCTSSITLVAQPYGQAKGMNDANRNEMCSEERLFSYFPQDFVRNTLRKYDIPQDQWNAIVSELAERDPEVIRKVEEKASKMTPNPLQDPKERHVAVRIFRETLTETFGTVVGRHGVTDQQVIQGMLDDIQRQKAELFAQCYQKEQKSSDNGPDGQQYDDDEDFTWDD